MSAAVNLLLRTPAHRPRDGIGEEGASSACARSCTRSCNPHQHREHCHDACEHQCKHGIEISGLLRSLVRKGSAHTDNSVPHTLQLVWDHARTAHRSRRSMLDSLELVHGQMYATESLPMNSSGSSSQRRLSFWDAIDFDQYSFVFVDTILQPGGSAAAPFGWNKEWGSRTLLGDFGGAGADAIVSLNNRAWLRVGLFGGGFGIHLDNFADASGYLVILEVAIFKAQLVFKYDATYRIDIPANLLNGVNSALGAVADGFETAKGVALKMINPLIAKTLQLKVNLDNFTNALSDRC